MSTFIADVTKALTAADSAVPDDRTIEPGEESSEKEKARKAQGYDGDFYVKADDGKIFIGNEPSKLGTSELESLKKSLQSIIEGLTQDLTPYEHKSVAPLDKKIFDLILNIFDKADGSEDQFIDLKAIHEKADANEDGQNLLERGILHILRGKRTEQTVSMVEARGALGEDNKANDKFLNARISAAENTMIVIGEIETDIRSGGDK